MINYLIEKYFVLINCVTEVVLLQKGEKLTNRDKNCLTREKFINCFVLHIKFVAIFFY